MNPTTDDADLLEHIRRSAAETPPEHRDESRMLDVPLPGGVSDPLPPLPPLAAPMASDPAPLAEVGAMLPRAREKNTVSDQIPGWLRPLWRNQGGFNGILLEACDRLAMVSQRLGQENARLREDLGTLHQHVGVLTEKLAAQNATQNTRLDALTRAVEACAADGPAPQERLDRLEAQASRHTGDLTRLESQGDHHAGILARMETQDEHHLNWMSNLQAQADAQTDQHQQIHAQLDRHAGQLDELFRLEEQMAGHSRTVDARLDQTGSHVNSLQAHVDGHTARLDELARQNAGQSRTTDERLTQVGSHVNNLQAQSEQLRQHIQSVHGHLDQLGEHVGRAEQRLDRSVEAHDHVQSHADRLGTHLNNLQGHQDRQGDRVETMQQHLDKLTELHERARGEMNVATGHHHLLEEANRRLDERQINDSSYLRAQLAFHQRLIGQWLVPALPNAGPTGGTPDGASGTGGEAARQQAAAMFNDQQMDALYLAFEDALRGSRHEIKERVRYYVPRLAEARSGGATGPVLDLGCGRGEWLEVLREENIPAAGVDLNVCMIDQCHERGLEATLANALDHLASLPDAGCGAITAFHLIEHLPFPVLVRFLTECRRVLQPGGIAIFETPNPTNLVVGACSFWYDYTHQRPLPPTSTRFLVEHVGFISTEIVPLHPWNEESFVHGDGANQDLVERFNKLIYGPQDYAVVARAAAHRN